MELNLTFSNRPQRDFYYHTERNGCFSGGFNNGKTWVGCARALTNLLTYNSYRYIIARQQFSDLKRTTMQTFFQMFPSEFVRSHNEQDGHTQLINDSLIFWLHLDKVDLNTLRGLEANAILVDQAEETKEEVFDVLDARVGRWSGAIVPQYLLEKYGEAWPRNEKTRRPIVPSYFDVLANPDTQFHYIYRKFHPESPDKIGSYYYTEGEWDASLGSKETYEQAIKRDPEWVDKYVRGQWGHSSAQIHFLRKDSFLDYSPELISHIKEKGNLFRSLDHGDSAPTCCLWFAAIDGVYICYREYYVPGRVISYHRQSITDLSVNEEYSGNYADPSIAKIQNQGKGGFWTLQKEYMTDDIDAPPLFWQLADNNEFATRNRINELLIPSQHFKHPITRNSPAPGLYFIQRATDYPYGCYESIRQLGAQRKELLGSIDGKSIYSDDRDKSITDHAYDCVRYFISRHGTSPKTIQKEPPRRSFAYFNKLLKRHNQILAGSAQ